jgi:hypothetical protein
VGEGTVKGLKAIGSGTKKLINKGAKSVEGATDGKK